MKESTTYEVLERRRQVRVRLRKDIEITPQKYEGRTYYVIKDPVSMRYYRFKEQEHFLLQFMDGKHTLDHAQKEFEKRFRPERLTLEDLEAFTQQLLTAGLAQNETPQAGKLLFDRRKKRVRMEWLQVLTSILYIKIPLFDPDKLLTRMARYLRFIFTIPFLLLSIAVMLSALMLVLTHFEVFWSKIPSYQEFFSFKTAVYLWVTMGVVKVIHEFGHGLSCKIFGAEVHEMGALFMVLSPCLYCNVSDAWSLPDKWKRIIVSAAGIYVELIIAAIATFVWWNTPGQPFLNNLCLSLMIVCSVSTVVFNANPLMRFDGYYILADWLEIPNLRERSNRYLKNLVQEYCLGIEVQPEPYMALNRKFLFVLYAVISWVYRWVIFFIILFIMRNWLPDKLKIFTTMLMTFSIISMFMWPIYRLIKGLRKRGRLPDMKSQNVSITVTVAALVLLFLLFVPLPISRVREQGLVEFQRADAIMDVDIPPWTTLERPGKLMSLSVHDGQLVKQGDHLAEFEHPELENHLTRTETELRIRQNRLAALKEELARTPDLKQKENVKARIGQIEGEIFKYQSNVHWYRHIKERLVITAPRDGIVVDPPRKEDVGKEWDSKRLTVCKIGDPTNLWVRVPVSPTDYRLLGEDWLGTTIKDDSTGMPEVRTLKASIRIRGEAGRIREGKLAHLQLSATGDKIPPQLTSVGGGPIRVYPVDGPEKYRLADPVFFAYVELDNADHTVCPGTKSQVKIHCRWRPFSWWLWRKIAESFNPGLV